MAEIDFEGHALPLTTCMGADCLTVTMGGRTMPLVDTSLPLAVEEVMMGRACPIVKDSLVVQTLSSLGGRALPVASQSCRVVVQVRPAYGPNLEVVSQPHIGGGCAITVFGRPNSVVYAYLVGIADDGYETEPYGRLVRAFIKTDSKGRAVLHYQASTNPAHADKRDRLIVYA